MKHSYITAALEEARNGGVTINVAHGNIVKDLDEWCFPRWPERTEVVSDERLEAALQVFIRKYKNLLEDEDLYIGIWKKDTKYYLDMNAHAPSFDDAKLLAKRFSDEGGRQIISAYNPARQKTKYFS